MPLLYRVTTKDNKISHLYGSCHLDDPVVKTLSLEVKQAFEEASTVLVESQPRDMGDLASCLETEITQWKKTNALAFGSVGAHLSYGDTQAIAALFDDELSQVHPSHRHLFELLENPPIYLFHKMLLKLISHGGLDETVDSQFVRRAESVNKPVISLDTAEDVAARLIGGSFTHQEQLSYWKAVSQKIAEHKGIEGFKSYLLKYNTTVKDAYLSGEISAILDKSIGSLGTHEILARRFQNLVFDRDPIFCEKMQATLKEGGAFVLFGAAHLPGVIANLQKQGMQVEPVKEGPREHSVASLKNTNLLVKKNAVYANCRLFPRDSSCYFNDVDSFATYLSLIEEKRVNNEVAVTLVLSPTFSGSPPEKKEIFELSRLLTSPFCPPLLTLTLRRCELDEECLIELAKALKTCPAKEMTLDILGNRTTKEGVQALIEVLKANAFSGKLTVNMDIEYELPGHRELVEEMEELIAKKE